MRGSRLFQYRLALALGMTRRQLLQSMSARELAEWQIYYLVEPWGAVRQDHRFGVLADIFMKIMGATPKKKFDPFNLMPRGDLKILARTNNKKVPPKKKHWSELLKIVQGMTGK
jgi:hypothetical protein